MNKIFPLLLCLISVYTGPALADKESDMAEIQRQLNAEVMAQPFDPGDPAKVDAYVREAMKKDLKPRTTAPDYWQPGWSCNHLTRYRHYRYTDYRDCVYHHRYYGRYW